MGFARDEERFMESMRRRASKQIGNETTLQQARQCAMELSERLLQEARTSSRLSSTTANEGFSFIEKTDDKDDASAASSKTDFSSERAVMRGARMGSFARRENNSIYSNNSDAEELHSEFAGSTILTEANSEYTSRAPAITSVAATAKTSTSNLNKRATKRKLARDKKTKLKGGDSMAAAADTDAAWMCGVCGKAFGTFEACDRHEEWHIQSVCAAVVCDEKNPMSSRPDIQKTTSSDASDVVTDSISTRKKSARQRLFTEDEILSTSVSRSERLVAANSLLSMPTGREEAVPNNPREINGGFAEDAPAHRYAQHEVRFSDTVGDDNDPDAIFGSETKEAYMILADEALVDVCRRATPLLLTKAEIKAERNLALLSRDKAYYDDLAARAVMRRRNPYNRFRSEGDTVRDKVQNKLLDAYQLMKQGDHTRGIADQYTKANLGNDKGSHGMKHSNGTLFVNVMVKNGAQVVKRELERLAQEKWERPDGKDDETISKFQRFRVYAHMNMVKLAGLALASDFTPRRIAIQLSNDLYRLMTPRLGRRGVTIESEIEYRVGGYFVMAVNILAIDWLRLMKANRADVANRMRRWKREEAQRKDDVKPKQRIWQLFLQYVRLGLSITWFDIFTRALSLLFHFNWTLSIPLCWLAYHSPLGATIRMFILSSVTDEIFFYVEQRGMEMKIQVHQANNQAAFMLQALREIRAGDRELKKKKQETEAQEIGVILGNLLGPAVKADKEAAPPPPDGFQLPVDLEFVSLEVELLVGFRRLRWALLSDESKFLVDVIFKTESRCENITIHPWERYSEFIGKVVLPEDVKMEAFVGVSKDQQYLMPKSAFVSANMAYETVTIVAYNDYCFSIKKKTRTPDVPFGGTFFSWTMLRFENLGNNRVHMTCSVEAEFPNGPPMIARQIQSGLRAGTADAFVSLGATITKYAEAFP